MIIVNGILELYDYSDQELYQLGGETYTSNPEVREINNQVGEKQKHGQLIFGGAKEFARPDIDQQLRKLEAPKNLRKPR